MPRTFFPSRSVCPTYVGMNRGIEPPAVAVARMPHVCGDEPMLEINRLTRGKYAPRMWG